MKKMIEGKHLGKGSMSVNMKTGETKPLKTKMMMLPAKKGTCEDCATDHEPTSPHNAQSLFYQYKFFNEHNRWPNWKDAMKHCSEDMKAHWEKNLIELGVDVAGGGVNPVKVKK